MKLTKFVKKHALHKDRYFEVSKPLDQVAYSLVHVNLDVASLKEHSDLK